MSSEDEKFFPSDYDEYYYYCRISIVEEAKEKYIKCNGLLLGSEINNSPAMKLLINETDEKKQRIYNKYKKLYQDFITYSDKLINKDNIDSEDIYIFVIWKNSCKFLMIRQSLLTKTLVCRKEN